MTPESENAWWKKLQDAGAVYECPKDSNGQRLGPLVAYAGKDESGAHYVGDVYVNFARAERDPSTLYWMALQMLQGSLQTIRAMENVVVCGLPEGGKAFGLMLAYVGHFGYCYPDQEVIAGTRKKHLAFERHDDALVGKNVILAEDVMNNFSTTESSIRLVEEAGGKVMCVCGVLNRSVLGFDTIAGVPMYALITKPTAQYRQSDPAVADDIVRGNLVLKPKHEWQRLVKAMTQAIA